ncbi:MAG: histidine phosphatase family protein [Pseudomonadota bacterium]|nr:histidine phosphatase family protein [Pseudomonadota bacterium]
MKLVLVRHARAQERASGQRDRDRRLTSHGRRRMRAAAKGLEILLPGITLITASPLLRAKETARILAGQYGIGDVAVLPALAPGNSPRNFLAWLRQQPPDAAVGAVGHEPDLGVLAGWLLAKRLESFTPFGKGAACLIEFAGNPAPGTGVLGWLMTSAALGAIGRCGRGAHRS